MYSDAQYVYWDLTERWACAKNAHGLACRDFVRGHSHDDDAVCRDAVLRIQASQLALSAAQDALATFAQEYGGESFLVFRPERVAAAVTNDIKPLFEHTIRFDVNPDDRARPI